MHLPTSKQHGRDKQYHGARVIIKRLDCRLVNRNINFHIFIKIILSVHRSHDIKMSLTNSKVISSEPLVSTAFPKLLSS